MPVDADAAENRFFHFFVGKPKTSSAISLRVKVLACPMAVAAYVDTMIRK
jgi:hypothetical protein